MTRNRRVRGALLVLITHVFAPISIVASNDSTSFQGVIIDSIVIDNRNIYDTDSDEYRHFIYKAANRLHYKTRQWVVSREVLLNVGQPFSDELAEETARNLRQRLPLYDAWIETQLLPNGHMLVKVVTIDVWTLSLGVDVKWEGGKTRYRLSAAERNLLGRNQNLSVDMVVEPDERDYPVVGFSDARFFGLPLTVDAGFDNNPRGKFRTLTLSHPYYNLSQVWSYSTFVSDARGRRDIYSDTRLIGTYENKGDQFGLGGSWRTGSYDKKIQLRLDYTYCYEQSFNKQSLGTTFAERFLAQAGFPSDSLYHQLKATVRLSNLDFVALRRIDGFGYTEDFTLGQALQVGAGRAFTDDLKDHVYDLVDVSFSFGYSRHPGLGFISYQRRLFFRDDRDLRRTAWLSIAHYLSLARFLTIATRGLYVSDSRAGGGEALTVGGADLRGFEDVFQTGDRKGAFTLEARFYPGVEISTVGFSPALFADLARTWQIDERFSLRGFYASVGVGMRVAFARSSRTRPLRIDVIYSEVNGWRLSIGTGQYFRAQEAGLLLTTP